MAKKRFTFADAKIRIQELEAQVEDLEAVLKEEFTNDLASELLSDDPRTKYIYGAIALVVGVVLGVLIA